MHSPLLLLALFVLLAPPLLVKSKVDSSSESVIVEETVVGRTLRANSVPAYRAQAKGKAKAFSSPVVSAKLPPNGPLPYSIPGVHDVVSFAFG